LAQLSISNKIHNTSIGYDSLKSNQANFNTAIGSGALESVNSGIRNTGIGYLAGETIASTGTLNTCIGANADVDITTSLNRIAIGANATATLDNTAVIGDNSVAQVFAGNGNVLAGVVTGTSTPVESVVPDYIGQIFINTSATTVYIAAGLANTNWVLLNS